MLKNIYISIMKNEFIEDLTFHFRNAKSKHLVLFGVPDHSRMRRTYRIFRPVQASDIGCTRDRSNVSPRR